MVYVVICDLAPASSLLSQVVDLSGSETACKSSDFPIISFLRFLFVDLCFLGGSVDCTGILARAFEVLERKLKSTRHQVIAIQQAQRAVAPDSDGATLSQSAAGGGFPTGGGLLDTVCEQQKGIPSNAKIPKNGGKYWSRRKISRCQPVRRRCQPVRRLCPNQKFDW